MRALEKMLWPLLRIEYDMICRFTIRSSCSAQLSLAVFSSSISILLTLLVAWQEPEESVKLFQESTHQMVPCHAMVPSSSVELQRRYEGLWQPWQISCTMLLNIVPRHHISTVSNQRYFATFHCFNPFQTQATLFFVLILHIMDCSILCYSISAFEHVR